MTSPSITISSHHFVYDKKLLKATLRQAGAEVARNDRALLRKAGSGIKYGSHIASTPGSPAARLSGALAKSVKVSVSKSGDSVRVAETMFYAKFLEVGAKGGGRKKGGGNSRTKRGAVQTSRILLPRPSLSIAYNMVAPTLQGRIQAALNGSVAFKAGRIKTK